MLGIEPESGRTPMWPGIGATHPLTPPCPRLRIEHRGFLDVAPGAAAEFNRRTPLPDGLPAFSVAGDPPPEEVCWPLRRLHHALGEMEGPNDGLVSVQSATAFGRPLPDWP